MSSSLRNFTLMILKTVLSNYFYITFQIDGNAQKKKKNNKFCSWVELMQGVSQ